jgi:hypothetical protein
MGVEEVGVEAATLMRNPFHRHQPSRSGETNRLTIDRWLSKPRSLYPVGRLAANSLLLQTLSPPGLLRRRENPLQ